MAQSRIGSGHFFIPKVYPSIPPMPKIIKTEDFMLLHEAAERIGIKPARLRYLATIGRVKAYRDPLNRKFRLFRESDIDDVVREVRSFLKGAGQS